MITVEQLESLLKVHHKNVIRFFYYHAGVDFVYIALQYCVANLEQVTLAYLIGLRNLIFVLACQCCTKGEFARTIAAAANCDGQASTAAGNVFGTT